MFAKISELNAKSVDPDQTPRSAESGLGLQCLPKLLLWNARWNWIDTASRPACASAHSDQDVLLSYKKVLGFC